MIDEVHFSDIQRDQKEGESGVPQVSLMNLILGISNEIKRKGKMMLLVV